MSVRNGHLAMLFVRNGHVSMESNGEVRHSRLLLPRPLVQEQAAVPRHQGAPLHLHRAPRVHVRGRGVDNHRAPGRQDRRGEEQRAAEVRGPSVQRAAGRVAVQEQRRDQGAGRDLPILNVTRRLRLQYAGHVLRGAVPPATRTRATLDAPPVTRRPVGGVRRRFYDQVDKEAKSLDIQDWRAAALDRPTWQEAQKRLLAQPDPREDRREAAKRRRQERQQQQDQQQHQDQDELGDP